MIRYIVSTNNSKRFRLFNWLFHNNLKKELKFRKANFIEVEGTYQGKPEKSFLLSNKRLALQIMRNYDQECLLEINNNRAALIYQDGSRKHIGKVKRTKTQPKGKDFTRLEKEFITVE